MYHTYKVLAMKLNSLLFTALAFILISGIFVSGCKKNNIKVYDFKLVGDTLTGHEIQFVPDKSIAGSSSFLWNFGDSTTSTLPSPTHTFQKYGSFYVSLIINNDSTHTIEKYITIYKDPVFTSQMAGTWTFHHYYTGPPTHISQFVGETTLHITYVNMVTILIGADTFSYINPGTTVTTPTISFYRNFGSAYNYGTFNYETQTQRMYYIVSSHISAGAGYIEDDYYAP